MEMIMQILGIGFSYNRLSLIGLGPCLERIEIREQPPVGSNEPNGRSKDATQQRIITTSTTNDTARQSHVAHHHQTHTLTEHSGQGIQRSL